MCCAEATPHNTPNLSVAGQSDRPSGNWLNFGSPVFYVTDLLQNTETLVRLGFGKDPRLANGIALIKQKQNQQGR